MLIEVAELSEQGSGLCLIDPVVQYDRSFLSGRMRCSFPQRSGEPVLVLVQHDRLRNVAATRPCRQQLHDSQHLGPEKFPRAGLFGIRSHEDDSVDILGVRVTPLNRSGDGDTAE